MAATTFHARSNSFPSRPHPLVSEFDEQLCRLRQSQAASTSSSSISHKLNGLQDVYYCVDKLIQLPSTQQAMIHDQNELLDNELLDGSLRLLDLCNAAKDALSQMKESVSELQSAIRRRQGDLVAETKRYLNSRKIVKKAIQKALKGMKIVKKTIQKALKGMENKKSTSTVTMLKESEYIVVEVLESLLSFISQSNSKSSSWSLVSKLIPAKKNEVAASENEFAQVDACLKTSKSNACLKTSKSSEEIQAHLKNLQPCVQDLEEGVESLFRCLIKTRASILNVHNL
ncbi:hypothetical protein LINGRAHAP2_LOCUS4141 [Linum grandiflorum]